MLMIMADKKTIGERIKFIRCSLGFNRSAFGRQLGLTSSSVANWERGKTKPALKNLIKIAHMGHTSVKSFLEPDERGLLLLDKDTALSLHASLYIILSNRQFVLSNPDDAKRIKRVDDKAKEVINSD